MDEQLINIQWYPGHMAKTRREISESLKLVDATIELLDARIPSSSRNPDILSLTAGKPRLIVLNRRDLADPERTAAWARRLANEGLVIETDAKSGYGCQTVRPALEKLLSERLSRRAERGRADKVIRAMVLGIPNVGKSSFINRISGRKPAKAENRPGVTRSRQWIRCENALELLDTPGMLWPKFEDRTVGLHLAFTGAIRDDIMDIETLAAYFGKKLAQEYPGSLESVYTIENASLLDGAGVLEAVAKRRGFMLRGGEFDYSRAARTLLDDFRAGRIGRITLDLPEDTGL